LGTVDDSVVPCDRPYLFQPERAVSVQQDIRQQVFSGHLIFKKNAFFPVCTVQVLLLTNAPHTHNQELHTRPHLPKFYHIDTLLYCILSF